MSKGKGATVQNRHMNHGLRFATRDHHRLVLIHAMVNSTTYFQHIGTEYAMHKRISITSERHLHQQRSTGSYPHSWLHGQDRPPRVPGKRPYHTCSPAWLHSVRSGSPGQVVSELDDATIGIERYLMN